MVETGSRAVIIRFGKVHRYVNEGLGFRFPFAERHYIVETETIR